MQITALKEIWKIGRVLAFWKELHQMKEAQTLVKPNDVWRHIVPSSPSPVLTEEAVVLEFVRGGVALTGVQAPVSLGV